MRTLAFLTAALALALTGCGRKPVNYTEARSADLERLQGTWAVIAFDNGSLGGMTEAEKAALLEEVQQDRLTFDGNRLTIRQPNRPDIVFDIILDETQNPKVMTVFDDRGGFGSGGGSTMRGTAAGTFRGTFRATSRGTSVGTTRGTAPVSGGPGGFRMEWIYKFDGDTLVLALGGDRRPADFVPRKASLEPGKPFEPGVVVVRLQKSDTPPKAIPPRGTSRGTTRK